MSKVKAYCPTCKEIKASSFRLFIQRDCPDEYEDLCCDECHTILATIEGGYVTKLEQENAELKRTTQEDAQTILTLIGQLRYCAGIAERGRKEKMPEDVTPEAYLLEYVKGLERIIAERQKQEPEGYKFIVWDGRKRNEVLAIDYIPQSHKVFGMEEIRGKFPLYASPIIQEGMQLVPIELVKFLNGESALDGVWYGEKHPAKCGMFWWRSLLNASKEGV